MKSDLSRHLTGIFRILKNRFDYINHSIGHSLTKGEENENEIRKLLIEFLPPQYGIGSGIIVDIKGNESKQVDIVIYDKSLPNYTLSNESKLFLADQVLATIEIKTTFTRDALKEALENTKSIKSLTPSRLSWVEPISKIEDELHQSWGLTQFKPSPPLSFIFFYGAPQRKTSIQLDEVFRVIQEELDGVENSNQPELVFSLEHSAFFRHEDIAKSRNGKFHVCLVNLSDNPKSQVSIDAEPNTIAIFDFGDNKFIDGVHTDKKDICDTSGKIRAVALEGNEISIDPLIYKTGRIDNSTYLIDSYRGFINFIYQIDFMLNVKKTNKNGFIAEYFPERFFMLTDYDNGLKFEDKS